MKHLIEFPLADGSSVIMEVDEPTSEGAIVRAAKPGEIVAKVNQTLEAALERVTPAAEAILSHLSAITQRPDEIEVEFGLKVSIARCRGSLRAKYRRNRVETTRNSPPHSSTISASMSMPRVQVVLASCAPPILHPYLRL